MLFAGVEGDFVDTFNQLKRWAAQRKDLGYVSSLLAWDQDVYMPKLALEHRSSQMATLSVLEHQMGTDPKVRGWLEELHVLETEDTFEGALVRVVRRSYEKTCKIPEAFAEDTRPVPTALPIMLGQKPVLQMISSLCTSP